MKHMRIIVTHYGGPDALRVVEEDCPEPKRGEVRVRVLAAGVSLPDIMAREGVHPETPAVPYTPGGTWSARSIASATVSRGWNPARWLPRCPYTAHTRSSSACRSASSFRCRPGLDAAEAVALILNYITAYQMLHRSAKVKPAQRVLFHGASGGVGTALLQLGRLADLEMYGTCSSRGPRRPFPTWVASLSITNIRTSCERYAA